MLINLAEGPVGQMSSIVGCLEDIPGTVEGMEWAICLGLCMVFGVNVIPKTMVTLELCGCQFEVGVGHNWPVRCTRSRLCVAADKRDEMLLDVRGFLKRLTQEHLHYRWQLDWIGFS